MIVIEEEWVGERPRRENAQVGGTVSYRGFYWWPLPGAEVSPFVPVDIARAYADAVTALAAGCPRASAVMGRRTLEAITADKGQDAGTLDKRLKALTSAGLLHPTLAEWATEVRPGGNLGAHFDPMQTVETDDARQLLAFLKELMRYLYELPAEIEQVRQQRVKPTPTA